MDVVTSTVFSPGSTAGAAHLDQVLVLPKTGLLALADAVSVGDERRAGIRIALDTMRANIERHEDILKRFLRNPTPDLRARILTVVEDAFTRAAQEVFAFSRRREELQVTLDVVLMLDTEAFVGHVGDGRVYLVRRGLVHQLTVDHNQAEDVFADAPEAPGRDDDRSPRNHERVLVRSLGPSPNVRVESLCMEITEGDRFVLCSRAVYHTIPDGVLQHHLVTEPLDALGPALIRCAPEAPLVAVAGQLGGGEPEVLDSGRSRLAILAPMPLFAHCSERELRIVASATHPRRFVADTVIFEQGEPGTELYLVINGRIRIARDGREIAVLEPGSNFGEMAMLDAPSRSASAIAVDDCEVMVISRESFFALLKGNPMLAVKILWNMLLRLSSNLRSTSERLAAFKARFSDQGEPLEEFELIGGEPPVK